MRRFALLLTLPLFFACAEEAPPARSMDGPDSPTAGVLPELTAEQEAGEAVWETVCWSCHGQAARGNGPAVVSGAVGAVPPNLNQPEYAALSAAEWQRRFAAVFTGQDSTHPHMRNVASYLKRESFDAALAYLPALLAPVDVQGSARAGAKMYGFRCAPCHGEDGRGHGSASDDLLVSPADLTTDTLIARGDYEALFNKIKMGGQSVHGSSMPPWGMMFSDPEIWDLVAYILHFQG